MCTIAFCGDGSLHAGSEECDDANMADDDACVGMCMDATCGDGFVFDGVEECDDANGVDDDACSNACVAAACGDNIEQQGEECDFGDITPGDGCSASCQWEARIVFTTSTVTAANFGGLMGADAICNMRAQAAGLPGTYMAWVSTDQGSPATRFVQSMVPYRMVNGTKVADDWTDLTDGTLDVNINKTELNGTPPVASFSCNNTNRMTWTGTEVDGTALANTCSNWSSTAGTGVVGRNTITTATWTNCAAAPCTATAPIYCFQQ